MKKVSARWGWIALGGVLTVLTLPYVGMALYAMQEPPPPVYDTGHPDYPYFKAAFGRIAALNRKPSAAEIIDFAPLNGGAWTVACLVGGYNDPIPILETLGATIDPKDRQRMGEAHGGWRFSPIEEYEVAIVYADREGRGHIIHFDDNFGEGSEYYTGCTARPKTTLAIGRRDGTGLAEGHDIASFRLEQPMPESPVP